jgi:hypothetical protein
MLNAQFMQQVVLIPDVVVVVVVGPFFHYE